MRKTSPSVSTGELSLRSVLISVVLTLLLATSNAYLALKLGLLTSASIPAAILSMGILRFFKGSSVVENNAVQTAASAGEAVAGGIVYTIPALIIIGYWHHFDYWTNVLIAFCGGVLGVLFSMPLRRFLVNDPTLLFPEGHAIAQLLQSSSDEARFRLLVQGGFMGALIELGQVGFHVLAGGFNHWSIIHGVLFGLSVGFAPTMLGAGFLIGNTMTFSIFLGAFIAWYMVLPWISHAHVALASAHSGSAWMLTLWEHELRYIGIGAMLFAGGWTCLQLMYPLLRRIGVTVTLLKTMPKAILSHPSETLPDVSFRYIALGVVLISALLFFLFQQLLPLQYAGFDARMSWLVVVAALLYVLLVGCFFSVITAYFSGMVGVTASPGSAVMIAGVLGSAGMVYGLAHAYIAIPLYPAQIKALEAISIIVASIVTGIAAVANDNTQDLKVGQLVGATPWKQQVMLLLGVLVSALVIPWVMQLLFDVYGIAGVMPHAGMDAALALPAPTAALFAAMTQSIFDESVIWQPMLWGALIIALVLAVDWCLTRRKRLFSILGVAVGMYLPLSSSLSLFAGGMIAYVVQRGALGDFQGHRKQQGGLIACGLVAGSAVMDVALALLFSLAHRQNILSSWLSASWEPYALVCSVLVTLTLAGWMIARSVHDKCS